MTREEQIIEASQLYAKHQQKPFMDGALWADQNPINYDGKAMLHVLNKGHRQGWKDATQKATEFIEKFAYNSVVTDNIGEREKQAIVITFKEFMEEQQ